MGSFSCAAASMKTPATAELMLAQILEQREGVEAAQNYVTRQLERHPTMRVFHKLMDYHLNEAEEGARRRASAFCAIWWASRCAANRATAARNAALPLIRCTGTVRPAGRGQPLNPFAASTGNSFKKAQFSYNILIGFYVRCL
jgi:hypothetical protein